MWMIKSLSRHGKKNSLLLLVAFVISVLFFISTAIRENSASQIKNFLATYKVTAYYVKKESFFSNRPGSPWLPPYTAETPVKHEQYLQTYSLTRSLRLRALNVSGITQEVVSVLALTDLTMVERPELAEADLNGHTNEDFKLDTEEAIALISTKLSAALGIAAGDDIILKDDRGEDTTFTVCGVFESDVSEAVIPIIQAANIYAVNPNILSESSTPQVSDYYDTNLYVLKDTNELRNFKLVMSQEPDFRSARFVIDDTKLNETIRPLKTTMDYMDGALVILLAISILIAFIVSFILLKSRSVEIAIMYCIGLPKYKIFSILFAELALTTLIAIVAGAVAGFLISLNFIGATNIIESTNRLVFLFAAFSLGAAASIISSIAIRPIDILTKKEE